MAKVYKPILEMRWIHTDIETGKITSNKVIEYDRSEMLEAFTAKERKTIREGKTVNWTYGGDNHNLFTSVGYKV